MFELWGKKYLVWGKNNVDKWMKNFGIFFYIYFNLVKIKCVNVRYI